MKTIKSLKDITTLEVGDKVVFGNLEYEVTQGAYFKRYYLVLINSLEGNDEIFNVLNINKEDFVDKLGIKTDGGRFPETYSLEALTALVSALFKEYEKQQNELPKTWEEFCVKNKIKEGEYLIINGSIQHTACAGYPREADEDKDYCVSKQEAEAFLTLMQLRQLRKAYVKNWEPDWTIPSNKYCISYCNNEISIDKWVLMSHVLSFPSKELANQFLINFRDLLEIAKPLL